MGPHVRGCAASLPPMGDQASLVPRGFPPVRAALQESC